MNANVLLASENDILRSGLEPALLGEDGVRSIHGASDAKHAREILDQLTIDVAIIDVESRAVGAAELIAHCRSRKRPVRCVALAGRPTRTTIERIMQAGAAGIVSTRSSARVLGEAVRRVHASRGYVSPDVTRILLGPTGLKLTPGQGVALLTARERDVVRGIAEGWSSREIAERFGISTRTVETHRGRVMKKLNLRKTAALVRFAVREGIVGA